MAWMQQQRLNLEGGELHCRYYPLSSRLELEWQGQQCFCQSLYGLPRRQTIVLNGQDYRLEIISLTSLARRVDCSRWFQLATLA
ncbi:hypothetical protein [Shewanella indica]|uniref:hypothetical protein n=1 Tax=Shewanella indica TaxID=768528 RepID=UPI00399A58FF